MRSVVVVLPASMCAMIPMLRVRANGKRRVLRTAVATFIFCCCPIRSVAAGARLSSSITWLMRGDTPRIPPVPDCDRRSSWSRSVPEVAESLVRLSHLVRVFLALDRRPHVVGGIHELAGELLGHRLAVALPGVADDPAPRQRRPPVGPDLHRHLVGGATHAFGLDLQDGGDVAQGGVKHLERLLAAAALADDLEGAVDDPLSHALLAVEHDAVDEFCHAPVCVHRIGSDGSLLDAGSPRHQLAFFSRLVPYLERLFMRFLVSAVSSVPRLPGS